MVWLVYCVHHHQFDLISAQCWNSIWWINSNSLIIYVQRCIDIYTSTCAHAHTHTHTRIRFRSPGSKHTSSLSVANHTMIDNVLRSYTIITSTYILFAYKGKMKRWLCCFLSISSYNALNQQRHGSFSMMRFALRFFFFFSLQ